MNTMIKLKSMFLLMATYLISANSLMAGIPNWTVKEANFQYNMTMTAIVNIDCANATNPGNIIGVFAGAECRGVSYTSQVLNGKYEASIFIYSNVSFGESLIFKIYDAAKDTIYESKGTPIIFKSNASYGNASSPFIVYSKFPCYVKRDILPVSNFLSPNDDGKNDFFTIGDVGSYAGFALTVYNEAGLEVYKISRDYKNDWGGTYEGKVLPTGAYFYTFKNADTGKEYEGIINLIKTN